MRWIIAQMRAHHHTHSELRAEARLPDFPLPGHISERLADALDSENIPRGQAAEHFHQALPGHVEQHISNRPLTRGGLTHFVKGFFY